MGRQRMRQYVRRLRNHDRRARRASRKRIQRLEHRTPTWAIENDLLAQKDNQDDKRTDKLEAEEANLLGFEVKKSYNKPKLVGFAPPTPVKKVHENRWVGRSAVELGNGEVEVEQVKLLKPSHIDF